MSIPAERLRRARAGTPSQQTARFIAATRAEHPSGPRQDKPDWALPEYFTQPRVIVVGILLCVLLIGEIQASLFNWSSDEPNEKLLAENCLHITSSPGTAPVEPWETDEMKAHVDERIRGRLLAHIATRECPIEACPAQEFASYIASLSGYLGSRMRVYDKAHGQHGRAGIKAANAFYRTNKDFDIIDHANRLIQAGRVQRSQMPLERFRYLELLIEHSRDKVPVCFVSADKINAPGTSRLAAPTQGRTMFGKFNSDGFSNGSR